MIVRIAVLDNDDSILQLMHEVFADEGWETLLFSHAAGAVETLSQEKPDAIILDARLDGNRGGWHVLDQLIENRSTSGIPVAIWTGGGDGIEDREHWLSDHQVAVMHKPFELDDVYMTLRAMLNRRQAYDGAPSQQVANISA
jgi:DNA-binding response OmpR family regulator